MEKRKSKRIETPLPEAMIHLIQSFLSAKEAARTTLLSKSWYHALLSKSWYHAWLTRPALAFDQHDFINRSSISSAPEFLKFAVKTMQRYQHLNLKIERFRLQIQGCITRTLLVAHKLIVDATKLGATDLNLEFIPTTFDLPPEVLGSETLLRLSVSGCAIDGNINCSMLKSLSLDRVVLKRENMLGDIISCCNSIEELSLSNSLCRNSKIRLSDKDLPELHKLKRLYLETVAVDNSFFDDLESRFPCLEDMSLVSCCCIGIRVTSSSLRRISIVQRPGSELEFEVPKLAVFSYSGEGIPSLSIKARDEWESRIFMECHHFQTSSSWYQGLHKLLAQLSPSRINLTINGGWSGSVNDIRVVAIPVAVENLRLETKYDAGCFLRCLFRICRPKLVTHCLLDSECWKSNEHSLKSLCEKLMGQKRGRKMFDLKEGKMEVYEEVEAEWWPLVLENALRAPPMGRKVRFHLKW